MPDMFTLGFSYYPEHYPEDQWENDLRLMREAGVQCIRTTDYAWSRLEPREGAFDFGWLDRFFDRITHYGIKVILCTPTDAAPPWAARKYPDIVLVKEDGVPMPTSARRYRCPTSTTYWRLSRRIIEEMATRYGEHPQLIGWQTDNELTGNPCFCESCQQSFRAWCREKYGSLDALNRDLGMVIWAHEYSDWAEVSMNANWQGHPSLRLEIRRFVSHAWTEYARRQVELIRKHSPGRFITHNLPGIGNQLDYFDLTAAHDFMSIDMYPRALYHPRWSIARLGIIARSLQTGPHWVMELTTGSPVNQFQKTNVPRPGQLRLWAHQNAAYGAQGVVFYPWRKRPSGYEMLSNGLLEHDGVPRRYYHEARQIGQDFARLGSKLQAYEMPREVALVRDFQDSANAAINPNFFDVNHEENLNTWMRCLRSLGLSLRYVRSTDDLTPYKLVIAPNQYTTSDEIAANYRRYVERGGTLLATNRVGILDVRGNPVQERMPGGMRDLFGFEIDEYERCMEVNPNRLLFEQTPDLAVAGLDKETCRDWVFILKTTHARTLAHFESEFYANKPGVTINQYGEGRALYLGSFLDAEASQHFLRYAVGLTDLETLPEDWDDDVESVRLIGPGERRLRVLLNHALEPRTVTLPGHGIDLLTEERIESRLELAGSGVFWLSEADGERIE